DPSRIQRSQPAFLHSYATNGAAVNPALVMWVHVGSLLTVSRLFWRRGSHGGYRLVTSPGLARRLGCVRQPRQPQGLQIARSGPGAARSESATAPSLYQRGGVK